ncbi:IclR family transcriptional regulator [uncultured Roseibium sp.]|uniref:IclR family transcriptional regulator n=1 Tax=uncultured Roseibium sp. TaxID=1936171 RepID=UPI002615DE88|nr:IclR family transcriptional regulator [uncultured Roseibium sp.]
MAGKLAETKDTSDVETNLKYSAPALSKGLDILELLAEQSQGLKKTEIAQALNRSVSEIYRMLAVLQSRGYVILDTASERYSLTMRMFELSHRFPPTKRLTAVAGEIMAETAIRLNQSVHMAILNGNEILVIAQVDPPGNNITSVRLGARVPMVFTSSGACLSFQIPPEKRAAMCEKNPNFSPKAFEMFENAVQQVEKTGVCESPSAIVQGVHNVAVPIIGYGGEVAASLTVPFVKRLIKTSDPNIKECKEILLEAGQQISKKIGAGAAV